MIGIVLVTSALLAGQVARPAQAKTLEKAAPKIAREVDPAEALAKYNELREKTPPTAAGQWKLGLWCEEHGLKAEAYVHFAEVVRRDPKRDAAWRKLGFKKVGRQWTTDEQIAEDNEQKKADKLWGERLKKIHKDIHGANGAKRRDAAQAALDAINDPRAIPSIYRAFGLGGPSHQRIAVEVLGRINRPLSSKVLAMLAVYGKTPDVRQQATVILRERPPEDFLELFVGMMIDPLKYEVKPVGGPGTPGILFVEGERYNVSRYYAAPVPNIQMAPGDILTFDQSGMPVIARPIGRSQINSSITKVPGSKFLFKQSETDTTQYLEFSPFQIMAEAQRAAVVSEAQLEADVAKIKAINADRKFFNDSIIRIAKDATGKDLGTTPKEWRDALAAGNNSGKQPTQTPPKPTYAELIPSAYNPVFLPVGFMSQTHSSTRVWVDT
ncbi:MAG: hypothetical protein ACLQGP_31370 [Isosphaeraceae bacterium]